ncbi:hypothetical protein KTF24_05965 [Burkholderia multivorans]|uniref:hypothetical protein n=1 Tax=Burkholderia multivorans TaxID=87883 RepID=UPI001C21B6CE|nr:hypothetical protein [Burkholderia multivorans]MBU9667325.1 hypothetical protein [Burkholderia multivorans]HEF4755380.1 hypothetical protein [Burkholderia multivorans]
MDTIIAGRFSTLEQAERCAQQLRGHAMHRDDVKVFFLNPPGQHALFWLGGDVYADSAARPGGLGALEGVAIGAVVGAAGAAVLSIGGLHSSFVWLGVPLVGAYIGALCAALGRMRGDAPEGRGALRECEHGVVLAAHVTRRTATFAQRTLVANGALSVERVDGAWDHGAWTDFFTSGHRPA